jgi:DNA-binding transcriptional LysR family regulator
MPQRGLDSDGRVSRRVKLRDLHILRTVVELGSMSKAASQLGITQPTISEAISDLEHAVGVRLLDRGPDGVVPTVYGQAFLKRGREAFDAVKQGIRDVEFLATPGAGDVWIGCSEILLGGFVPDVIQRLAHLHPKVVVHAAEINAADFDFHALRERKLDLILGRIIDSKVDSDLNVELLFTEAMSIVVGPGNRWAKHRKIALSDLMDEPWIFGEPNNFVQALVSQIFGTAGLGLPKIGLVTTSMQLRLPLIATGKYISAVPNSLLRYTAERWSLKALPIDLGLDLSVGIFTLKNRTLSPVVQVFIDTARSICKAMANDK